MCTYAFTWHYHPSWHPSYIPYGNAVMPASHVCMHTCTRLPRMLSGACMHMPDAMSHTCTSISLNIQHTTRGSSLAPRAPDPLPHICTCACHISLAAYITLASLRTHAMHAWPPPHIIAPHYRTSIPPPFRRNIIACVYCQPQNMCIR